MERTYAHIDLDERRKIARWRTAKLSVDVIAEKLGRHRSTIFRELKRYGMRLVLTNMDPTGTRCSLILSRWVLAMHWSRCLGTIFRSETL